MSTGNIRSIVLSASDKAQSMDNKLRDNVFGGDWDDEVGRSYLSYTESLRRITEKLIGVADTLENIERSLQPTNETAGKAQLEKMKAMVQNL